jgi:hypothetical protein
MKSSHKACRADRIDALAKLSEVFSKYVTLPNERADLPALVSIILKITELGRFDEAEFREAARSELTKAISSSMTDNDLSDSELARISELAGSCNIDASEMEEDGNDTLVNGLILRDVRAGIINSRIPFAAQLPINLKHGEEVLWFAAPVTRMETKTRTKYVGASQGFSFRIMRGVSYRVGAFQGEPIQTTSLIQMGEGGFAATNLAIYFLAPGATYRMSVSTISTVECYADGICLTPNRGKSQIFLMNNPAYACELVKAIGALT